MSDDNKITFFLKQPGSNMPSVPSKTYQVFLRPSDEVPPVADTQTIQLPIQHPLDGVPVIFELEPGVSCCTTPGYHFYWGFNAKGISAGSNLILFVQGGCGPYVWQIGNNKPGFSFAESETVNPWNTLHADLTGEIGDIQIIVHDACENVVTGIVKNLGTTAAMIDSIIDQLRGKLDPSHFSQITFYADRFNFAFPPSDSSTYDNWVDQDYVAGAVICHNSMLWQANTEILSGSAAPGSNPNWVGFDPAEAELTTPFVIGAVNGQPVVAIRGDLLVDGSVQANHLNASVITAIAAEVSDLFVVNSIDIAHKFTVDVDGNVNILSGTLNINNGNFVVAADGTVTINQGSISLGTGSFVVDNTGAITIRSGTSGARQVITSRSIKVYDNYNTLRVHIGDLTDL